MAEPVQPGPSITAVNTDLSGSTSPSSPTRKRASSAASAISYRLRRADRSFHESSVPLGFFAETAELASSTLAAAKEAQKESQAQAATSPTSQKKQPAKDKATAFVPPSTPPEPSLPPSQIPNLRSESSDPKDLYAPFPNGYHFPPKYGAKDGWRHFYKGTWKYITSPLGFFVTLYALNVVAWGGMLFLLLCNAAPAMCHPNCNDLTSPRRTWLEIDMQILNALFCVTGFGLVPWRFRDLAFLLRYRLGKDETALRRLGGVHRNWIRLPGSDLLPVDVGPDNVDERIDTLGLPLTSIPFPTKKTPPAPLTATRAPPTALWKVDFVIWMMILNTCWQVVLSTLMWALSRFERPSWSTGFAVAMACSMSAMGGIMMFTEGKRVKSIEGVPLTEEDKLRLELDQEMGVLHYNNIQKKKPKEIVKQERKEEKAARKSLNVNRTTSNTPSHSNLLGAGPSNPNLTQTPTPT